MKDYFSIYLSLIQVCVRIFVIVVQDHKSYKDMKKFLLLFGIMLFSITTGLQASETSDNNIITIHVLRPSGSTPHSPGDIPIYCTFDTNTSCIYVTFFSNLGYVDLELENITTGEYNHSLVNSAPGGLIYPFSGTSGLWVITFTLSSGEEYTGEFSI